MIALIITAIIAFAAGAATCAVLLHREIRLLGDMIVVTTAYEKH